MFPYNLPLMHSSITERGQWYTPPSEQAKPLSTHRDVILHVFIVSGLVTKIADTIWGAVWIQIHQWYWIIKVRIRFQTFLLTSGAIFYHVSGLALDQRTQCEGSHIGPVCTVLMCLWAGVCILILTSFRRSVTKPAQWAAKQKKKCPYRDKWGSITVSMLGM